MLAFLGEDLKDGFPGGEGVFVDGGGFGAYLWGEGRKGGREGGRAGGR